MKKLFPLILLLAAAQSAKAQQYPLFSNYVTNAFGFNPAFTGVDEGGEIRLMHRAQWANFKLNPTTSLANINLRVGKLPIGIGGTFYTDKAGRLDRTGGALSLAFHQKLGQSTTISLGASAGYFKNLLQANYVAKDPNDNALFTATGGQWAPDMTVGLTLRHQNLTIGASMPQFLEKVLKFDSDPNAQGQSVLERHYYLFGSYRIYLGKMYLEPSAMVKMASAVPTQVDVAAKFGTGTPLWLGLSYRGKAAAAAMIGVDLNSGWSLAYAYDLTTSGLSKGSLSSHEVTLIYRWGNCTDKDKDGICDKKDKCPEEPGTKEKDGCPDKKENEKCRDTDSDGICDADDECPNLPGTKENKGCPTNDRDRDGVPDDEDKCPDVPGFKQFDGCPMNDRDNDGIRDDLDKCPDEAGPVTNFGCPQGKGDGDGDGIPDEYDPCPNTPGSKKNNGCPEVSEADRSALNLAIQNLYFDTDKWIIKAQSKPHLDRLAKVLKNQPGWKVHISGHADARGSNEHNLTLSKNRSEAVMYYLMARGVKREQLIVEYYGEANPVGNNKTPAGLAENRRVDMEFVFN